MVHHEADTGLSGPTMKRQQPVLVLMPFLGASWKEWASVIDRLNSGFRCIGVDLPGFGDAAEVRGYAVSQMVEYLAEFIAKLHIGPFLLVGHSMSGKVAMAAARLHAADPAKFYGLQALVLVASSPPLPEPMEDSKRRQMLKSLGTLRPDARRHAETYIRENLVADVDNAATARLVDEVLRMNPAAWTAWLQQGSKEDWSDRVGTLHLPALVVAGADDKALGPETQAKLVVPHFSHSRLAVVEDCGHLVPVERPAELADLILNFLSALSPSRTHYELMIDPDRVSARTREVLLARSAERSQETGSPSFSESEIACLRSVIERVLPSRSLRIDLTARLLEQIEQGKGKGWRYAELPPAVEMYKRALGTLDECASLAFAEPFVSLPSERQDELLANLQLGEVDVPKSTPVATLTSAQMQRWFEELRGDVTGIYVSHPDTLARLGYSGIADGADSQNLSGFVRLGMNQVEDWEPKASGVEER